MGHERMRIDDRVSSLVGRVRALVPDRGDDDRRNIATLARRLDVSVDDARWIYQRSRDVGFGAAMTEYEAASTPTRGPTTGPPDRR